MLTSGHRLPRLLPMCWLTFYWAALSWMALLNVSSSLLAQNALSLLVKSCESVPSQLLVC